MRQFLFSLAGLLLCWSAFAVDGVVGAVGTNPDSVRVARVAAWWDTDWNWMATENRPIHLYWEANASYWHSDPGESGNDEVWEVGVTPVLRMPLPANSGPQTYIEGGIGAHLISETEIEDIDLSSAFHFGSLIGVGMLLDQGRLDLGVRLQHLSNAGIVQPNHGIDLLLLRLGRRLP